MVRLQIFLLLLLMFPSMSSLGHSLIKGTVAEPDGKPLAYANVLLLDPQDSSLVVGTISDEGGR